MERIEGMISDIVFKNEDNEDYEDDCDDEDLEDGKEVALPLITSCESNQRIFLFSKNVAI